MANKVKIKIFIDGQAYESEDVGEDLFDILNIKHLTDQIIQETFERLRKERPSRSDAVFETAVVLGVSERTVWRVLHNCR